MKSNLPDISLASAATVIAGGYGSAALRDSRRPTIVTCSPASSTSHELNTCAS